MMTTPDPSPRNRILWGVVCWFHAALLVGFGASFLAFGINATAAPTTYAVFVHFIYGGMHTYGAIMLVFAALLLYGLLAPLYHRPMLDRYLRKAMFWVCGYDILLMWLFVWSWALSHRNAGLSVFTWACLAGLAGATALLTPMSDERARRAS